MKRPLIVEFTKMNGAGNDFIVIDNRFYHFSDDELSHIARQLCPRRRAIGADGLLALNEATSEDVHYRMRYINADGSLATMCGNGARCLAAFARTSGMRGDTLSFESDAGVYEAAFPGEHPDLVRLFVAPPEAFHERHRLFSSELPVDSVHTIWTGTEHAVLFVDDVDRAPVNTWGPLIRQDASVQPAGTNVNFVEVVDRGQEGEEAILRVRTFEKGVEEETLACGTGALAAAVTAHLVGKVSRTSVRVEMPGGVLRVGFARKDGAVDGLYLEGPAETVYRGTVELDPAALATKT